MKPVLIVLMLAAGFVAGFGYGRWYAIPAGGATPKKAEKKILYWVDPMHPSYKSDKPGRRRTAGWIWCLFMRSRHPRRRKLRHRPGRFRSRPRGSR